MHLVFFLVFKIGCISIGIGIWHDTFNEVG